MYLLFTIFLIFCLWLKYELNTKSRQAEQNKNNLFEIEREANSTRKQSIDNLDYITISKKSIPVNEISDNELKKIQQELLDYADKRILNLSGYTNTELKKLYGPANLPILTEYDQNFMSLVNLLHKYAVLLNEKGYIYDAISVLEYSISINSDMSNSFKLLADLYFQTNQKEKISELIKMADNVTPLLKKSITAYLQEYLD